jgi:hypothetical protein
MPSLWCWHGFDKRRLRWLQTCFGSEVFDEDVWTIVILLDKEFDVVRPADVRLVTRVASLKIGRLRQQLGIGRCGRRHIRWIRRHLSPLVFTVSGFQSIYEKYTRACQPRRSSLI